MGCIVDGVWGMWVVGFLRGSVEDDNYRFPKDSTQIEYRHRGW
jgi:hypothetical protein